MRKIVCRRVVLKKNDIPSMIRMSKDTGKIQFLLTNFPTKYEKLDYLEPILRELEPPGDINIYDYFIDQSIIKHHHCEYNQLAMTNFRKKLIELEPKLGPHDEKNEEFGRIYSMLKILNMNDAVDELSVAIIDNPEHALKLFHKHHVLLDPKFDPLKASKNLSAKIMQLMNVDDSDIFDFKIPPSTEIGEYIMKKLVQNPSSFNAAEHVIDIYAQNDLYKILQSLDTGLKSRDHIVIKSTSDAMNEILDNIWQDAEKTANRHKDIQHGINIISGSLAAVAGDFITNFFGMCEPYNIGSCGLVGATTGVTTFALSKKIFKRINIDEIILSALNPNYLINIYGFNKKYKLGSN